MQNITKYIATITVGDDVIKAGSKFDVTDNINETISKGYGDYDYDVMYMRYYPCTIQKQTWVLESEESFGQSKNKEIKTELIPSESNYDEDDLFMISPTFPVEYQ